MTTTYNVSSEGATFANNEPVNAATITAPSVIYVNSSEPFINDISFSGNSDNDSAEVELVRSSGTWSLTNDVDITGNGTSVLTFTSAMTIADINSVIADPNPGTMPPYMGVSGPLEIDFTDFYQGGQQSTSTTVYVAVDAATPTLTTATPSPGSVTLSNAAPGTLTDSAVLSGGANPTGSITFTLTAPGGATVDTETVTVNGDETYTTPKGYTVPTSGTVAGTYQWDVSYSGDDNNQPVSDVDDHAEQVNVSSASPTVTTTASAGVTLADAGAPTLSDSAVLAGGFDPTGSITFTLTGPGGATVDTETATVNGNGTYSTPTGYKLPTSGTVAGTYSWVATYNGDGNNNLETGSPEQTKVSSASPELSSIASARAVAGSTLTDVAQLSGGYSPTGTITFTLTAPGGATVDTETVTVTGDGAYTTPTGFTVPNSAVDGTYSWLVTYNGDGNNSPVNAQSENALVGPAATPAGTSADMIMSRASTGSYEIYDIGNNTVLGYPLTNIASPWQVAGLGNFSGTDTSDMMLRDPGSGAFEIVDVSNNNAGSPIPIGNAGLEWTVSGFGDFSGQPNETDMLMRDSNNGDFEVYDIANNTVASATSLGNVGLEWSVLGFGDFSGKANETDVLMRNSETGNLELYDISNNQVTSATALGNVGSEWQFAGAGDFSGRPGETDMLMRDTNTGDFEVYDFQNGAITSATALGNVGLNWTVAGFGDFSGHANETDMLLRDSNTGNFELYDISDNNVTSTTALGNVGLEWQVDGIAPYQSAGAAVAASGSSLFGAATQTEFQEAPDAQSVAPVAANQSNLWSLDQPGGSWLGTATPTIPQMQSFTAPADAGPAAQLPGSIAVNDAPPTLAVNPFQHA
jgi:hypothetical protein